VEVGQGERPALESLRLQEHVNLTDYCRFFYHQAVHANIIGLDKVLGPVCISIQKVRRTRTCTTARTHARTHRTRVTAHY
jgi:hypothetical protein